MSNIRRITILMLVAAIFAFSAAGCKSGGKARPAEHPTAEHPKVEDKKPEHPKGEHPKAEHPQGEHPK